MQGGLQIRLRRFDSDLGLHHSKAPQINVCGVFLYGSKNATSSVTFGMEFRNLLVNLESRYCAIRAGVLGAIMSSQTLSAAA